MLVFKKYPNLKFYLVLIVVSIDIILKIYLKIPNEKSIHSKQEIEFSKIEEFDKEILLPIQPYLEGYIETTKEEQKFLNGLIRKIKPKKVVEIGIAAGGTSALILNAIKDIRDAKLISIDVNKNYYRNRSKLSGFIVEEKFRQLMNKWEKYTGGIVSEFIENIGNNIDLVYIDTVHVTPGEMINFLEILPFLKEEAIIVLHDTFPMFSNNLILKQLINFSNNQILCYTRGELILPSYYNNTFTMNIGAVKLNKKQQLYHTQYFLALGTQWHYLPSEREIIILENFFKKYYEAKCVKMFNDAVEKNKQRIKLLKEKN